MTSSKIEWTDRVWNPTRGCTKVSAGCKKCYAETFAERWRGIPGHPFEQGFDLRLVPEKLDAPLRWRKASRVFVNSMSDLFHEDVPDKFIAQVFGVMSIATKHTFQVLTKRPDRMASLLNSATFWLAVNAERWYRCVEVLPGASPYTLPNVWLGVSCEDQANADGRIPILLDTPAAVRFVSLEPLLGPIDLDRVRYAHIENGFVPALSADRRIGCTVVDTSNRENSKTFPRLDWVIIGGESGPGARVCAVENVRSVVRQCLDSHVPVFVKQLGACFEDVKSEIAGKFVKQPDTIPKLRKLTHPKGGNPDSWPDELQDLNRREWPHV